MKYYRKPLRGRIKRCKMCQAWMVVDNPKDILCDICTTRTCLKVLYGG
jgi:hypothetical protein